MRTIYFLALCAFLSRCFTVFLGTVLDYLIEDYDSSDQILERLSIGDPGSAYGFSAFSHWDGVYFMFLAEHCRYLYEHFTVFLPLYPGVMTIISKLLYRCVPVLPSLLPTRLVLIIVGMLVSNIAFVFAAVVLYYLTLAVTANRPLSILSSLLFCITPAGVFMSAVYTESLYSLLSFAGMFLWVERLRWCSTVLFFLAACTRSNGMLLSGFFFCDILHAIGNKHCLFSSRWDRVTFVLGSCIRILLVCLPLFVYQYYLYSTFCETDGKSYSSTSSSLLPTLSTLSSPLCTQVPWYSLYRHLEHQYWGISFFGFYQWKQLPNFLIALPTTAVCVFAIYRVVFFHPLLLLTAGLTQPYPYLHSVKRRDLTNPHCSSPSSWVVFIWYLTGMLLIALAMMHIQVINRFVVACPALYWTAASLLFPSPSPPYSHPSRSQTRFSQLFPNISRYCIVFYFLLWNVLGCLLFCNFYPWT